MSPSAYSSLLEKARSGQFKIISILAPARSSSTALERALLESPSIDMQINDPWAIYDEAAREDKTYDYIARRIEEADNPQTVLIKNIADYIPPGECWQRWDELVAQHVFLIRNPLLTLHSLLKMIIKHFEEDDCVIPHLTMNEYAMQKGFDNWKALQIHMAETNNFTPYEDLYKSFFPKDQKIHDDPVMLNPVTEHLEDLDFKAEGFKSKKERAFAYRITGWEALFQHVQNTQKPITTVDSTLYRAHPNAVLENLSKTLSIKHTKQAVNWSQETGQHFNTDYDEDVPYYGRVENAVGIEPPLERPLPLKSFPPYFQYHLTGKDGALEVYLQMLKKITPLNWDYDLYKADPVFNYVLCTIFPDGDTSEQKAKLRSESPEFLDLFDWLEGKRKI